MESQFQIGLIFIAGILLDFDTFCFQPPPIVLRQRVQVTDDDGWEQPECQGMPRTAICSDEDITA
jgi:hypothetical protein